MNAWIEEEVAHTVAEAEAGGQPTRWRPPLVAYASADDPLFAQLRQIVRPSHATPEELLPGARSVIAFFLPFEPQVPASNRPGRLASQGWAQAYLDTNALVGAVSRRLAEGLRARGFEAAVQPATHNFDEQELMSDWSHKHVAYIAGLGQFGIHRMLITASGCAGRLGTLVTTAPLAPTPRSDQPACVYLLDRSCTACLERCPVSALTPDGFDRHACWALCLENRDPARGTGLADACGKCASAVPCSLVDPVARKRSRRSAAERA